MNDGVDWKRAGYGRLAGPPVTVGSLRRTGRVLEIHCGGCARMKELDPKTLPFDDDDAVPSLGLRGVFKCSRCGSRAVTTRPQVYEEPTSVRAARAQKKQRSELEAGT